MEKDTPLSNRQNYYLGKFSRLASVTTLGLTSLTACSQQSECGQVVELDINRTPNAFMVIDDRQYSVFVEDDKDARRISISEGSSIYDQLNNPRYSTDLIDAGEQDTGTLLVHGTKVSFISNVGQDAVQTKCEKSN